MKDYQLIGSKGIWHLTQQQARPPKRDELACHTSCGKWAEMKDGYQRGRPTCPTCLEHVRVFEKKAGTPRLCPGCRSLDGEHDFGETCTLTEETIVVDLETSTRLDFLVETTGPTDVLREVLYGTGRRRRAML